MDINGHTLSRNIAALLFCFFLFSKISFSQKQVILIRGGTIIARFNEGQYFKCVLKKNHRYTEGHIIELNDFSMITSKDTIQFKDILKVDVSKQRHAVFTKILGSALLIGGRGYIGLDRLNYAVNNIGDGTLDNSVLTTSSVLAGAGIALLLIRPSKYQHVNEGYFLHTIDYTSPFFQP